MATYLVTGANRGLGLEFVRQLSARGERVIATARDLDASRELREVAEASPSTVRLQALEVTSPESVCKLAGALADEAVDVLINNAGTMGLRTGMGNMDYENMERCFRVNVVGAMRVAEAALPALERGGTRHVVNMSSKMGSINENTSGGAYSYRASKCALNMVTKSMSIDLGDRDFTCVAMHPGWVLTDMGGPSALIDTSTSIRAMLERIDGLTPEQSGTFIEWSGGEIQW
jgi:NAD(P)-dependent dehydrogenase (short-subunit alcohol dehydrogenase family)